MAKERIEREDIIRIAEGLKMIEEGVARIQGVMREKGIRSLKDVAAELIPVFQADDEELTESVIQRLS
jgi:hypothetical protein